MVVEYPKACVVAHEGVFFGLVGFGSVGNDVHVKVLLVPLLYLIVGEELFPAVDAFDG